MAKTTMVAIRAIPDDGALNRYFDDKGALPIIGYIPITEYDDGEEVESED